MHELVLSKDIEQTDYLIYIERLNNININSGLYGLVGNWLISNEGDLLYFCTDKDDENAIYRIYSYQYNEQDWPNYLTTKIWFKGSVQEDFIVAFEIAKELILSNGSRMSTNSVH
jgi:hypothetical protein